MSKQLGRISGPLLNANLLRDGNDLRFENQLLYLDVTNKTLSINSTPINKELFVNGTLRTDFIIIDAPKINVGNLEIGPDDLIKATSGTVVFSGSNYVNAHDIQTANIDVTSNVISTYTTDTNLNLSPTGSLEIYANTNITGSLHATGDITADGSVIFGNNDSDNVSFSADVNSNIIPDLDLTYSLGSDLAVGGKRWADIYTVHVNGQELVANTIGSAGVNVILRPGKIWFVASNGTDTNRGNHENSPYATVKKALSVASSGDTIRIYPGTYTEIFPLTVPVGITIKGAGLRAVTVQPTSGTNTNNAFLLNGETTVSDLTVSNFYQGYAFSFAANAKTTTRSPYIQNVSVITSGVNAGKGALVDGSVCDATTYEAAMLFHNCTFITPGVDALTMTNGVRVEWLNSFTYFANRSLYATQGVLGLASLGIKFGAEVRAIASASVYGNYGAVADGASTLMYLIEYNFGYVGAGLDSSNDQTLVILANETVELNSGKIYYQSVDQQGNFRVGDQFYVDFDKGTTSIDIASAVVTGASRLIIGTAPNQTFIDYSKIDIGDFTLRDNTILTRSRSFEITPANGLSTLTQNVQFAKDLYTSGNIKVEGTLTVGNQTTDTVNFASEVSSDILPKTTGTYDLGSGTPDQKWKNLYSLNSQTANINLSTNGITTTSGNLVLTSTNKIKADTSNVVIDNNLTVSSTSYFNNVSINGAVTHTGNYLGGATLAPTTNTRTGNTLITGQVITSAGGTFANIDIAGTTLSSTNITLAAASNNILFKSGTDVLTLNGPVLSKKIQFANTGQGYIKFANMGALAMPIGDSSTREPAPETGQFRINNHVVIEFVENPVVAAEVYSGNPSEGDNGWIPARGLAAEISYEEVEAVLGLWGIILG
jgi:cytoskeletal protein CcmA (bactofilin family)